MVAGSPKWKPGGDAGRPEKATRVVAWKGQATRDGGNFRRVTVENALQQVAGGP